jgi:hypothetical protein
VLADAELLLGMWRHLSTFAVNPATAQLDSLAFAGRVYEMAWRLRGSGVSSPQRVDAIAMEAAIRPRELRNEILPTMEQLGWVEVQRLKSGELHAVSELIPPGEQLLALADHVLAVSMPSPRERAALSLVRITTRQPLAKTAAMGEAMRAADATELETQEALRALESLGIVRIVADDAGRVAVFNPNVWVGDAEVTRAALRAEDARVNLEVGALIEEVAASAGLPEAHVKSTESRWVDFAVAHGLVQRSVVQTTDGQEQRFLFTPHLTRDPFGGPTQDSSGHARQLVGSMVYAATFARFKLEQPAAFVRSLIRYGEAGDASPIGTDYPMLETAGIVRVVAGSSVNRFRLQLLQADVAERALEILNDRTAEPTADVETRSGLRGQRSYVHVEKERARLASVADVDDDHRRRLLAALRDTTARRSFGGT